jgi:hypothetical protein
MALVLLTSSDVTDVSADSGINDDVFLAGVGMYAQATQDEEAATEMKLF